MKKLLTIILSFLIVLSINSDSAVGFQEEEKIDSLFLNESLNIHKKIPIIVEFKDDPVVVYSLKKFEAENYFQSESFNLSNLDEKYKLNLVLKQDQILSIMRNNYIDFKFKERCTTTINAVLLDIIGKDISKLLKIPDIKKIYDDRFAFYATRAIAADTTGAKRVWERVSTQKATGKGVLVGVIDSGLDKNHPEFSEEGKVKGGYNFVDNDEDFSDFEMHGTHVTGIIGGKGSEDYQRGMAYEASFMIYKVFNRGSLEAVNLVPAIDRAVEDQCNVINLSIAAPGPFESKGGYAHATAIKNATKAGVIVVAGFGDWGSRGKVLCWTSGSLANSEDAIAVGATDDRSFQVLKVASPAQNSKLITGRRAMFTPPFDKSLNGLPLVNCGYGYRDDFKEVDVKGKIAIVMRGPIDDKPLTFREKVDNAMEGGAKAVIIYNHTPSELIVPQIYGNSEDPNSVQLIPTVFITKEDGELLLSLLDNNLKLEFEEGGGVSILEFSSMGPTIDACFKPEISAPGSSIYSTVPGGYGIASGTSMASPMIAGLAALIKEVHPDWKTAEVKSALMNTATIIKNPYNGKPITFLLQGAGEADVSKALNTPALIEPRAILIQEPDSFARKYIDVTNITNNKVNFSLSYELFLDERETSPVSIELSTNSLSLSPGSSGRFTVKFNIDKTKFERSRVEGIIKLNELHIPFIIFKDSVSKIEDQISNIKITPSELYFTEDKQTDDIEISFSLNYGDEIWFKNFDTPEINYNSNYGILKIVLTDTKGEEWLQITEFSDLIVGDHKFYWNGRDSYGNLILPKGEYELKFITYKIIYSYPCMVETKEIVSAKSKIKVIESIVPAPLPLSLSCLKAYKLGDEFNLDFYIQEIENLKGIEFNLEYDSQKLSCKDVIIENFFKENDSEISKDIDDSRGIVKFNVSANKEINGNHIKLLSINFKTIDIGELNFKCNSCFLTLSEKIKIKANPIYPKVEVSNNDFLLSDINSDKVVDKNDLEIFILSYGTNYKDAEYNEFCDFNQDQYINVLDLLIISKELGKSL
jgi:minor extracellular serine protease Vpr